MPQGDKSSYTGKQRRKAHHIEEGYEKRGVSKGEAESRAWATVNDRSGGGKKSGSGRSHSHGSGHSGSHSHSSSHSRGGGHSRGGSHSSKSRSRSRSRGFTLLGIKGLPKWTPYALGAVGLCGLVIGLMQIDAVSDAVDPVLDDISEFLGITDNDDAFASRPSSGVMSQVQ